MSLSGVAFVTGAGGPGIGGTSASALVREGCQRICITDINPQTLDGTAQTLKAVNGSIEILAIPGDISKPEFVDSLFKSISDTFGRLDYAVNSAGVLGKDVSADESSIDDFDRVTNVNYRGLWLCQRAEIKLMKSQEFIEKSGMEGVRSQRGSIVNIASQLGIVGRPNGGIYCASKAAVMALTRADAIDVSPYRIRINAVCPGYIDTPMTRPTAGTATANEDTNEHFVNIAPMRRKGTAEEIADVVAFLSSERASFVQGASWVVDGGYTIN